MFIKKRYLLLLVALSFAFWFWWQMPTQKEQIPQLVKSNSQQLSHNPVQAEVAEQVVITQIEQEAEPQTRTLTVIQPRQRVKQPSYKVRIIYPDQHVFDDNLCNMNQVRRTLEPDLKAAIERLGDIYQHNFYQVNEYITLNLYTVDHDESFTQEYLTRIEALHNYYVQLLDQPAKRPITLNMVITPDRDEYLQQVTYFSPALSNSLGVYFGAINLAYVDYQESDEKALKTTIHETVHALNAFILGRTPSMFNEGMAELFEDMVLYNDKIEINSEHRKLNQEPYNMMEFFDDNQWPYLQTSRLYYSSWLWFAFMSSDSQRIDALTHFMREELKTPCYAFSADESYQLFHEVYNMFEYDFNEWQEGL